MQKKSGKMRNKKTQSHGCEVKPGLRSPASYPQQNGNKLLFFLYSVNFFWLECTQAVTEIDRNM